jgi:parvulin-like peptidyl-prolyl isomerase
MKRILMLGLMIVMARTALGAIALDGIAAHVNDAVITVGEVKEAMAPVVPQLRQIYEGAELEAKMKEVYAETLDDLINAKLILKAYEADTKVNKDGVDKYVEKKVSDFVKDRFGGDRQEFLKVLRDEHLSMEEWRRRMRERIIVGMMRSREVDSKVVVSPKEVSEVYAGNPRKYYREERVKLRVIVIHGGTQEADRRVRERSAKDALSEVRGGADFADLARKLSEDGNAEKGGDWGWVEVRDLRPDLAKPVASLSPGKTSDVIRMDGDYYLIKLEERQPAGPVPFEEVRSSIEKELRRKEVRHLTAVWMDRLRKDAYIQIVESAGP